MVALLNDSIKKKDSFATKTEGKYISGLDGLRGIAVIGVTLYHMFPYEVKGGFLGVSLFFVLSGYLIAVTSKNKWENDKFDLLCFYKNRIKRIYPPLLVVIFATIGVLKLIDPEILNGIRQEVLSIIFGYNNWWQILQNSSYFTKITNASPFTHLWYLAIEFQFYLLWPLLFIIYKFINKSRLKKIGIYIILVIAMATSFIMPVLYESGTDLSRIYYGTDTRIFALLLGVCMGLMPKRAKVNKITKARRDFKLSLFEIAMMVVFIAYIFMDGQGNITYRGGMLAITLIFCGIIELTMDSHLPIGRMLDLKPLSWIGKRSYEIYLWQYPVIFIFNYLKLDNNLLFILLQVAIILILSEWLHYFTLIRRINWWDKNVKKVKKISFVLMTYIALFILGLGGCSFVIAPEEKDNNMAELQEELHRNSQKLEEQQKKQLEEKKAEGLEDEPLQEAGEEITEGENRELEEHVDESEKQKATLDSITAVGDSIMLGASPAIKNILPQCIIDAKESRQVTSAKEIIENLDNQGNLGKIIIIALGTNGPFDEATGQDLIDYLGKDRTIYWVTVYGQHLQWQNDSNFIIHTLAEKNDNVHIIDWENTAPSHPEWFYDDGIHLNADGQVAYADLLFRSISNY